MKGITCKTCDAGTMQPTKKYRMSGAVVLIGYILLIPSVLGMAFAAMLFFATGKAGGETFAKIKADARAALEAKGVPAAIVARVVENQPLTPQEKEALPADQRREVDTQILSIAGGMTGAGAGTVLAGGSSICMGISAFVGGLLGWLLVMKKKVLQCMSCGAVVAAG
ncbi:MAG: hypothetical protein AB7N76_35830 [Planctomycetota bacterium]